jgi:acetyl esterase/lipase
MEVFMVKSKANKDATDLAPVIHFHGGGGYMGNPEKEVFCNSRIVVENRVAYFSVKYRLGPEV